ncbi:MAG: type II toxin-antitoxin system VapC family toxin [Actinobacteria bacterium]|nr:type II toxin-antitoxin system VapC family toxin [Actinomycetota bacterium]MCG2802795.1 type II toxin-antitoxin system VapC family toxin [Cellulomonas sp.]
MAHYIDTSALVKLVVVETETAGLHTWITTHEREPVSCDLARTELLRAVRRGAPDRVVQARTVLDSITLMTVTTAIFEQAGRLDPTLLRSLDALQLAAALSLGDDLEGLVTYDDRLAEAARANGVAVLSPA